MWWQDIQGPFLIDIISKINNSRIRDNAVDSCGDLFDALNKCWRQHNIFSSRDNSPSDFNSLFFLLSNSMSNHKKRNLAESQELLNLAILEPRIMNHDILKGLDYDPFNISEDTRNDAQSDHKKLLNKYNLYLKDKDDDELLDQLIKKIARMIFVIRSNIKHGEKTPKGPDIYKVQRDRQVCEATKPLLELLFNQIFDFPDQRLAVYGTLLPGQANHQVIAHLEGGWSSGTLRGLIKDKSNLPGFVWDVHANPIEVQVFTSAQLPAYFGELDRFEGSSYCRIWVPVLISESHTITNVYALNEVVVQGSQ